MRTTRYRHPHLGKATHTATLRALNQARDSAQRAYEQGKLVSRVFNWLRAFNHPSPSSRERAAERWNCEMGTRIGASASSREELGVGMAAAAQSGLLTVSTSAEQPYQPPMAPEGGDAGEGGNATPEVPDTDGGGKPPSSREDERPAPRPAPGDIPKGGGSPHAGEELLWDFVL